MNDCIIKLTGTLQRLGLDFDALRRMLVRFDTFRNETKTLETGPP